MLASLYKVGGSLTAVFTEPEAYLLSYLNENDEKKKYNELMPLWTEIFDRHVGRLLQEHS